MLRLPRAGWLALGAIVAALLADGGGFALPLAPAVRALLAVVLVVAAIVAAALHRAAPAALLLALGTVSLRAALATILAGSAAVAAPLPTTSGEWSAAVTDVSSPSGAEQRAFVHLHDATGGSGWLAYAWLPRHPALVPGDEIIVRGTLKPPPDDGGGFAGFLESRGAAGTLKGHELELVGNQGGFSASVEQLRWGIDDALSRAIPEPEAGLASGILIGLRERVSRAVADDFTVTGLTHVVAISGWNIALVAGIATALLRATGMGRRLRSGIVIAAIVAYTILAGAEASVIRAALMGGVVIIARESGRPSGAAAALGLACWGLLLVEPAMIGDIGLQLSLAATAGLLALGGQAEAAVRRVTRARAPRWFGETLGVSLAAQLSTLPLILLHFGRLSLVSPLANLLVAPVVPVAMLGAAAGVLVGPLLAAPVLGLVLAPLLVAAWLPLAAMTRGAGLLAQIPGANLELPGPMGLVGATIAAVSLAAALRATRHRAAHHRAPDSGPPQGTSTPRVSRQRRLATVGISTLLVAAVSVVLVARPAPMLQVHVLDIGQGDAILLEASDGDRLLVDGGPDPDLLVRRLDERIPVWDRHIDLVLLTHPHEDHAGGLAGLAPRYSVGGMAETGMVSEGSGVREMRAAAQRHGIGRVRLAQGDSLRLGQARVEVVWPPRDSIPHTPPSSGRGVNGTSIVLSVSLGRQRILLTGDLEDDHDDELLAALPQDGRRWDLLKVAHHGSATASSTTLLEALRPRLAAISSGVGNPYGHPAPQALDRLARAGATIWRTDLAGTLSLALDGRPRSATALLSGPAAAPPCPAATELGSLTAAAGRAACYARPDGGTHPNRSALTAHVHRALTTTAAARDRGGRGRRVPGTSRRMRGRRGRPQAGRSCRAPPRHRQGAATRAPLEDPRTRCRRGGLAARGRTPRARAGAGGTPGLSPGRGRCRRVGRRGAHRRAHRDLRRQARHRASGLAGAALRALAAQAPRVPCGARSGLRQRPPPRNLAVRDHRHRAHGRGASALGRRCHREGARSWRPTGAGAGAGGDRDRGRARTAGRSVSGMSETPPLAYFWGEDAFSIERAARTYAQRLSPPGETMEIWRASLDEDSGEEGAGASAAKRRAKALDGIEQHLGMAPLFGAGTLVVIRQPAGLLAEKSARERLLELTGTVPPGNALCVTDLIAGGARGPAAKGVLRDAIEAGGGVVQEFKVPGPGQLEPWLVKRASELEIELGRPAARLLAERVGGHIRESDVDRRRRTELANAELEKLALYQPGGSIGTEDVEALVSETIPGSTWAFLDAVGARAGAQASALVERLLAEGTPLPVLITQIHRRLRDLILVREHLDAGTRPPQMVKELKLQPFRAKKLSEQARNWSPTALEAALAELLALDLRSKGISLDGSTLQVSDRIDALAVQTWIARHAAGASPGA